MTDHESWMKAALKEAQRAFEQDEIPVGAVIVHEGKIIGKGRNQMEQLQDPTAHAEMIAVTAAANYLGSKYLNECSLYVTLEPCVMCAGALQWVQLQKLVFGASDFQRGYTLVGSPLLHPKTTVVTGIKAGEAKKLIDTFFKGLRDV